MDKVGKPLHCLDKIAQGVISKAVIAYSFFFFCVSYSGSLFVVVRCGLCPIVMEIAMLIALTII